MIKVKLGVLVIGLALAMPILAEDTESAVKPAIDKKSDLSKEKETLTLEHPANFPDVKEDKTKESPFKNAFKKYRKDAEERSKASAGQQAGDSEKKKFGPGVTKPKDGDEIGSMGISPWRGLLALLIVASLLGAFFYFLRKIGRKFTGTEPTAMSVKSKLQLDSKNALVIVKAYDEEFLVGVGTNGINLISRFMPIDSHEIEDDDETKAKAVLNAEPNFTANLKSIIDSEEIAPIKDKKL